MNDVGFVIAEEEDLALGPGTRLDHLCSRVLLKYKKGTEKTSDIDIRRGMESAALTSLNKGVIYFFHSGSVHFSSVTQSCLTLCDPMDCSTPGFPVHHHYPVPAQTHVHQVGDAIQPPHPLSAPSPPAPNPSQHQSLFQWVNSSHEVAKVLEFQH